MGSKIIEIKNSFTFVFLTTVPMIEQIILEKTCEALFKMYGQSVPPERIGFEKTKKEIEGDFTIVVFPLTRYSKKSPEATAGEIGHYLQNSIPDIKEFTIIKGFLNLILKESFWISFLVEQSAHEDYGITGERDSRPV